MNTETLSAESSAPVSLRPWWIKWLVAWGIVVGVVGVLLANNAAADKTLWRVTRWVMGDQDAYHWADEKAAHAGDSDAPFYERVDPPLTRVGADGRPVGRLYSRMEKIWRVSRDLGEPFITFLLLLVVLIYHPRGWRAAVVLLAATVSAGLIGELIRVVAGRIRPNGDVDTIINGVKVTIHNAGDNFWQLGRGFSQGSDLSFPSGHATLAFATAAALSILSPRGRGLFLGIATCCALSRVVMQAHFYSDVIFGAALGYTVGAVVTWGMRGWMESR